MTACCGINKAFYHTFKHNHPVDQISLQLTEVARHFAIPGKNGGQTAKEFAHKNVIDVHLLDNHAECAKQRASKRKLHGRAISVPCPPSIRSLTEKKVPLIESGEITSGVPCSPYTLSTSIINFRYMFQEEKFH